MTDQTSSTSRTPRTDGLYMCYSAGGMNDGVSAHHKFERMAGFARTLEREAADLREQLQGFKDGAEEDDAHILEQDAFITDLRDLCERLKMEAQIHAQEARTANATIAEIYQIVTGKTGEPGNWNGAEPVRERIKDLRERLAKAEAALKAQQEPGEGVHIIFDGPPSHESGRFVEVETPDGRSISWGRWEQRGKYWHLIAPQPADGVVVPREGMLQAAKWLENEAAKSVNRREYLLAATALLAAAKEPR